ncbi:PH domain-containing protein [Kytococcus aerolatus]|uniref:PH domain-containing protein n=1 Tax=Kytococcus aerolatus TaxID=592308 RepID=UPI000B587E3A|nr:PH domain-containing protein [Kytococcus aerolatus]
MPDLHPPHVLYEARLATWSRVLGLVLVGASLLGAAACVAAALTAEQGGVRLAFVLLTLAWLAVAAAAARATGQRFTVTSQGLEMRGILRTVRLAWAEVHRIEADRRFWAHGGVLVHATNGRRHRPAITRSRYAVHRGESVREAFEPAGPRPLRAAVAAHQQYLAWATRPPRQGVPPHGR